MKKIKMMVYGEPGVGKSVFALGFPKPFFITTDGNYEWLEDFGADENAYKQVNSWKECKEAFHQDYNDYETIVLDLTEDAFKWSEQEFCVRNKIDHVGDLGFGKGYDITREEFFIEICKLIAKDKNIILLTHGETNVIKDRRGVDHTLYRPTTKIPEKLLNRIEGRLRYVLRAYLKGEEEDGYIIKKRYLSLVPKENEYGIIRGIDENKAPQDIPLSAKEFLNIVNDNSLKSNSSIIVEKEVKKEEPKKVVTTPKVKVDEEEVKVDKEETKTEEVKENKEETKVEDDRIKAIKEKIAKLKKGE